MKNGSTDIPAAPPGYLRFALVVTSCSIVWLIVLPWWGRRPAMEQHLDWLDERGIDPSAMYYTELPAMEPILQRLEARHTAD